MSGVPTRDGSPVVVSIVFRHLSPAAFCKRNVLSVVPTVKSCEALVEFHLPHALRKLGNNGSGALASEP
jgi:hypothetical protein